MQLSIEDNKITAEMLLPRQRCQQDLLFIIQGSLANSSIIMSGRWRVYCLIFIVDSGDVQSTYKIKISKLELGLVAADLMKSMKLIIPLHYISSTNSLSDVSRKFILPNMIRAVTAPYQIWLNACQKISFSWRKIERE